MTTSDPRLAAFRRAFSAWGGDSHSGRPFGAIYLGCETRNVPREYHWDGLRRGADPRHPQVMFQATLAGRGAFESGGQRWEIASETAFMAVLPSRHAYYLPTGSPQWTFFWFTFAHPFVVQRISALIARYAPVFTLPSGSVLAAHSLEFFKRVCRGRFEDRFAEEGALLNWMLTLERHLYEQAHPRDRREAVLEEVRRFTLKNLDRSFGVDELARRLGLARSHFSHRFRRATGMSPGAFVLELRLSEVCRHLRQTHAPLKEVAARTGFADATHLCRAFRRVYHLTPGAYRRQVLG